MAGLMAALAPSSGRAARLTCLCQRPRLAARTTSCLRLLSLSSHRSGASVWGCCSPLACRLWARPCCRRTVKKMPPPPAPGRAAAAAATAEWHCAWSSAASSPIGRPHLSLFRQPVTGRLQPSLVFSLAALPRSFTCMGSLATPAAVPARARGAALARRAAWRLWPLQLRPAGHRHAGAAVCVPAPRPLPSVSRAARSVPMPAGWRVLSLDPAPLIGGQFLPGLERTSLR